MRVCKYRKIKKNRWAASMLFRESPKYLKLIYTLRCHIGAIISFGYASMLLGSKYGVVKKKGIKAIKGPVMQGTTWV